MERVVAKAKRTKRKQNKTRISKPSTPSLFGVKINVPTYDFTKEIDTSCLQAHSEGGAICQPFSRQNEISEPASSPPGQKCPQLRIRNIATAAHAGDTTSVLAIWRQERAMAEDSPSRMNALQRQLDSALLQAAMGKNTEMIHVLLDSRAKVTKFVKHHVVATKAEEVLDLLIERGVEFTRDEDSLLLHDTARVGDLSMMQKLLALDKLDVNARSRHFEQTVLHVALQYGKSFCANLLLDAGADIMARDSEGRTPLHEAALKGNEALVSSLINRGADPGIVDNKFKSPWFLALQFGHMRTADRILKQLPSDHFHQQFANGQCFSHVAAEQHSVTVLKKLKEMGVSFTHKDNEGNTVLMSAMAPALLDLTVTGYLLEDEEVRSQINHQNNNKDTVMSLLFDKDMSNMFNQHVKTIARTLHKAGASVNIQVSEQTTLLMRHLDNHNTRDLLLELGADHNITAASGRNILWMTCHRSDRYHLLQKLLELNIDIRQSHYMDEERGTTAFLEVLEAKDERSAELLYRSDCSLRGIKTWLQTDDAKEVLADCPRIKDLVTHMQASGRLVTAPSLWELSRLATLGAMGPRPIGDRVQQLGLPATVACLLDYNNYLKWQEHEAMVY